MEENDVVLSLGALAHPLRLRVFRRLVVAGKGGLVPGGMSEELGVPAATLSFHLKELMFAGMVQQERAGRNLIYRASFDRMDVVLAFLTANCCQGEPCLSSSALSCDC